MGSGANKQWQISKHIRVDAQNTGDMIIKRFPDGAIKLFFVPELRVPKTEPEKVGQLLMEYDADHGLVIQPIMKLWFGVADEVAEAILSLDSEWISRLTTAWWLGLCLPHLFNWANEVVTQKNMRRIENLWPLLPLAVRKRCMAAIAHELSIYQMTEVNEAEIPLAAQHIIASVKIPPMFLHPAALLVSMKSHHWPGQWHCNVPKAKRGDTVSWWWNNPEGARLELDYDGRGSGNVSVAYYQAPASETDCGVGGVVVFLMQGGRYTLPVSFYHQKEAAQFLHHEVSHLPDHSILNKFLPALDAWITATLAP